jgi:hypothetical protein
MIRPLTKIEFIDIATNGISIDLYGGHIRDYITNLVKFIEDTAYHYYVSDYEDAYCAISRSGNISIKVIYENGKIHFRLPHQSLETKLEKETAGNAIKIVYMHSVAWDAINNDGKINQPVESWPI